MFLSVWMAPLLTAAAFWTSSRMKLFWIVRNEDEDSNEQTDVCWGKG